jgi:hypothetical protein
MNEERIGKSVLPPQKPGYETQESRVHRMAEQHNYRISKSEDGRFTMVARDQLNVVNYGNLDLDDIEDFFNVIEYDHYFGVCPICHKVDGNAVKSGRDTFFYCETHKKKWPVGSELTCWSQLTEEEKLECWNDIGLDEFEDVLPFPHCL